MKNKLLISVGVMGLGMNYLFNDYIGIGLGLIIVNVIMIIKDYISVVNYRSLLYFFSIFVVSMIVNSSGVIVNNGLVLFFAMLFNSVVCSYFLTKLDSVGHNELLELLKVSLMVIVVWFSFNLVCLILSSDILNLLSLKTQLYQNGKLSIFILLFNIFGVYSSLFIKLLVTRMVINLKVRYKY